MVKLVLLTLLVGLLAVTTPVVNGLATGPVSQQPVVQIADGAPPADPGDGGYLPVPMNP